MSFKTNFRLVVCLFALLMVFAACTEAEKEAEETQDAATTETAAEAEMVAWNKVCPICGDEVDPEGETVTYEGKVYGFGCAGCPDKFAAEPEKYAGNLSEDGTEFIGD